MDSSKAGQTILAITVVVASSCGFWQPSGFQTLDSGEDFFFCYGLFGKNDYLRLAADGSYTRYGRSTAPVQVTERDSGSWRQLPTGVVELSSDWSRPDVKHGIVAVSGIYDNQELEETREAIGRFLDERANDEFSIAEIATIRAHRLDAPLLRKSELATAVAALSTTGDVKLLVAPWTAVSTDEIRGLDPREIESIPFVPRRDPEGLASAIDDRLRSDDGDVISFTPFRYRGHIYLESHNSEPLTQRDRSLIKSLVREHGGDDPFTALVWMEMSGDSFETETTGAEMWQLHPRRLQELRAKLEDAKKAGPASSEKE